MDKCPWALNSPEEEDYHDHEWGVPVHDDRLLFELLVLEGAQAGLSWRTVLRKRAGYRLAFDGFDVERVAAYDARKVEALLGDPGIVRNRLKILAAIGNARAFLAVRAAFGSFDSYLWRYVDGAPVHNRHLSAGDVPAATAVSAALSRDLANRGFRFVGPTICYAYMQAAGLVNDHLLGCHRHAQLCGPGGPAAAR